MNGIVGSVLFLLLIFTLAIYLLGPARSRRGDPPQAVHFFFSPSELDTWW